MTTKIAAKQRDINNSQCHFKKRITSIQTVNKEYFKQLQQINQLRLIQKLAQAKPLQQRRQDLLYFENLHEQLMDILSNLKQTIQQQPDLINHINISLIHRSFQQIFKEGSLKYLEKVCRFTGLAFDGFWFDIQDWVVECRNDQNEASFTDACKCCFK